MMFKRLLLACAVATLLISSCISCVGKARELTLPPYAVAGRDPAIAKLLLTVPNGMVESKSHCTAWKLDDRLIITAGHCCMFPTASYKLTGRHAGNGPNPRVLYTTQIPDICVMQGSINGPNIRLARNEPMFGEAVWTVGYPWAVTLMSDGYWTGLYSATVGVASTVVIGGASGSPMFNSRGEAFGILFGGDLVRSNNVSLVTRLPELQKAIAAARLKLGR